ncbi:EF-hand domain-containing protein [Sphingomonas panacisoli]|uniref:EF-hand domain-containing protein n=1 Tax=Sphingomonas panacisoli TaxID=1813879 RepID=A0A5B8LHU0_9SPHN|nr:EF-hand domain-containing protein [Sphingomonas panacisoli]QDZ07673.1 EF-hand domain-containing protein [Sphingomonas panacisoli]
MWRYLAGAGAGALLVAAGMMLQAMRPAGVAPLAAMPAASAATGDGQAADPAVPEATAKTREEKRFNRYDKDRNGAITRDEYLAARKKAYGKLDTNGDGTLSFDEWAVKAETKFAAADADKSGAMNATEFATTAVKRKVRAKTNCADKPAPVDEGREEET